MTQYQELAEKSEKQLASLRIQQGTLNEKINSLATSLGLDPSSPLQPQIEVLRESLQSKHEALTLKLQELTTKLQSLEQA